MKKSSNKAIRRKFHIIVFLPLTILCLLYSIFAAVILTYYLEQNTKENLETVANVIANTYDILYPGDYTLVGDTSYKIYKGDQEISNHFEILDDFYVDNQIHLTLFYEDTRIVTTIRDDEKNRIIGTGANPVVIADVLLNGQSKFYTNMDVNGEAFYAFYKPLYNSNGMVTGMFFAGIPRSSVGNLLQTLFAVIGGISIVIALLIAIPTTYYIRSIINSLQDLATFLNKISAGNLSASMPISTLKRQDELGLIGHAAVAMQTSLKTLIEQDSLTKLYNRRYADKILQQIQTHAKMKESEFVLVICDIDFFKRINDTYGHNCGDFVLKEISATLRNHMMNKGYAARWGGEEFVLVYSSLNSTFTNTTNDLEDLMNEIRNLTLPWGNEMIHITMTFGVARGDSTTNIHTLLQEADKHLYSGKENGRDQIVY